MAYDLLGSTIDLIVHVGRPKVCKRALCRRKSSQTLTQFQLALLGSLLQERGWDHKVGAGGAVYPPVVLDSFPQLRSIHRMPLINRLVRDDTEICNAFIRILHSNYTPIPVFSPCSNSIFAHCINQTNATSGFDPVTFFPCHWGIANDRNPTKIYTIDINHLTYIMYIEQTAKNPW